MGVTKKIGGKCFCFYFYISLSPILICIVLYCIVFVLFYDNGGSANGGT